MRSSSWLLVVLAVLGCRAPDADGRGAALVAPLVAPLIAPSVAPEAETASAPTWGPERNGLRLRVEAPVRVSRGDDLTCDLRVQVDLSAASVVPTIDARPPAYFARMRLARSDGGDAVVVVPTDPGAGMPDPPPPPGEPLDRRVVDSPSATEGALGRVRFPLASQWDRVTPGRWRGVVYFVHDGTADRQGVAGSWKGILVSQEFEFEVTAVPDRWLDVRAPAALLGGDVDVQIRFPVRNGFAVGLQWSGHLDDGSTGGCDGGAPRPGMFDDTLARIAASRSLASFELFETSYPPEHAWHPGPGTGHYRVLWSRDVPPDYGGHSGGQGRGWPMTTAELEAWRQSDEVRGTAGDPACRLVCFRCVDDLGRIIGGHLEIRAADTGKLICNVDTSHGNRAGMPVVLRAGRTFTADLVSVPEFGRTFPVPPRATFTVVSDTDPGRVEFCVPQSPEGEVRVGR